MTNTTFPRMSSFRLLANCLANTTRKYFMSTSEVYSMRQQAANQAAQCIVHFDRGCRVKAAVGTPTTV